MWILFTNMIAYNYETVSSSKNCDVASINGCNNNDGHESSSHNNSKENNNKITLTRNKIL